MGGSAAGGGRGPGGPISSRRRSGAQRPDLHPEEVRDPAAARPWELSSCGGLKGVFGSGSASGRGQCGGDRSRGWSRRVGRRRRAPALGALGCEVGCSVSIERGKEEKTEAKRFSLGGGNPSVISHCSTVRRFVNRQKGHSAFCTANWTSFADLASWSWPVRPCSASDSRKLEAGLLPNTP